MAYVPPHVSVTEVATPSVAPLFDTPTSIALIGEALGYRTTTETVLLDDSTPYTLKYTGVNLSSVTVTDATDPTIIYTRLSDWNYSTDVAGNTSIFRNLYTSIVNGETVTAVITTSGLGGGTSVFQITLTENQSVTTQAPNGSACSTLNVQRQGAFLLTNDYTVNGSGDLSRNGSGSIINKQTVYVDYATTSPVQTITDEAVVLDDAAAPVHLAKRGQTIDPSSIRVKNAPGTTAVTAINYIESISTTGDYTKSFNGLLFTITRNVIGPTTIGAASDRGQVRITYNSTSTDYYFATRFFNQGDVEAKYGAALDSSGNINSKVSFGALMSFQNGASDVTIQPVYHTDNPSDISAPRSAPTDYRVNKAQYVTDWDNSVHSLRNFLDVNVIVPVVGQDAYLTDGDILTLFGKVQAHVQYMYNNDEQVVAILGEDSTTTGRATASVLRAHATTIGNGTLPERLALVSPANFTYSNPTSGTSLQIGGQYVAAAVAGMLSAYPVQTPLTRKSVSGVIDVKDYRTEADKNTDAGNGLLVVENKLGQIRVRHAITCTQNTNYRELSVVRARQFMMESIRKTIDTQIIGVLFAGPNAPFAVSSSVQGVLETLVDLGIIEGYSGLFSRSLGPSQPSKIEIRFTYLPAYPLNYVDVIFSVDTSSGAVTSLTA